MNTDNAQASQSKVNEFSWNVKTSQAIKLEVAKIAQGTGKIIILDFIVGFLLIFRWIPQVNFPPSALLLVVYVSLKLLRRSQRTVRLAPAILALFLIGAIYVFTVSTFVYEISYEVSGQRLIRIFSVVLFALLIADGRIDLKSLILGFGSGLIFNAVAFYAGVAPAPYGEYLAGWIGDKNVAGLYHAIVPLVIFVLYSKPWQRITLLVFALPLLWATGSRTSIGAFIIAILWMLFAGRLNLFMKFLFGGLVIWLFEWAQENFADSEVFGDRAGTDWFREQIDNASLIKVQNTPWFGQGLGQATVPIEGKSNQFFHNSFWTLYVEGGWPWTILVLGVTLIVIFIMKQPQSPRQIGAEATTVVLLACSWRLGEVILTMPWGLAMGLALYYLSSSESLKHKRSSSFKQYAKSENIIFRDRQY
ncbi:ABC transporter permease [Rothia sp. 32237D007AR]